VQFAFAVLLQKHDRMMVQHEYMYVTRSAVASFILLSSDSDRKRQKAEISCSRILLHNCLRGKTIAIPQLRAVRSRPHTLE
jgi:membrane protein CcdC involved in cytochrome C biogenesis